MDKESEASSSPQEPATGYASQEAPETKELVKQESSAEAYTGESAIVEEEEEEGGPVKTFLEHLEDLRWVIIRVVAALGIGMVGCMVAAPVIVDFLQRPLLQSGATTANGELPELQPLGPLGPFLITMKLALYGGIVLALPFILYFISDFVLPALKKHEKAFFLRAIVVGAGLFLVGVAICYFFALPMTLRATIQYSRWMGFSPDFWRAEEYFSFVTLLMVCMGASFEVPILVLCLVKIGLIQYEWLTKGRPYFFIITFAVVAFITPDFVSTFFLVLPLMVLMEICIWIARYWHRKEAKEALQREGRD